MAYQSKFYGQEIDDAVQAVRDKQTIWTGKQDKLTGSQGQVVGFNSAGNAVPQGTQDLVGPPGPAGPPGLDGATGPAGAPGEDGFSPTVDVTEINGGHRVTITDADGPHTFDVMDGKDVTGGGGTAGVSSFNGRNGTVTPQEGDYNASMIEIFPSAGMTATNVQGAVSELFQSVSEGKALIASAVTDKGVNTAADASFQTMHNNILAIETSGSLPENMHTITLTADPPEGGSVSGGGVASGGMTLTVKAEAADGYNFSGLYENGETVSVEPEYTFIVNGDKALTAEFTEKSASRLPTGYTEVEYIQSSGTQYIDTGISPDNGTPCQTKVTADMQYTGDESPTGYYLGSWTDYYNYTQGKTWRSGYYIRTQNGVNYANIQTAATLSDKKINEISSDSRITITLDGPNYVAQIDEESISLGSSSHVVSGMPTIYLFCYHNKSFGPSGKINARLWSAQIEQNGALIRDFIPCIDPNGAVGLYDMVEGKFYSNSDTEDKFIFGPAI